MRVLTAILFSILLLGGIGAYIRFADSITPKPVDLSEAAALGQYSIDVTLTFDARLSLFSSVEPFSLQIRFRDRVIFESRETIEAGTPIRIENVPDVKAGKNEFWVSASPGDVFGDAKNVDGFGSAANVFEGFADPGELETNQDHSPQSTPQIALARAIRVRVFRDNDPVPVAEKTLWSDQNAAVQGAIDLFVEPLKNAQVID